MHGLKSQLEQFDLGGWLPLGLTCIVGVAQLNCALVTFNSEPRQTIGPGKKIGSCKTLKNKLSRPVHRSAQYNEYVHAHVCWGG